MGKLSLLEKKRLKEKEQRQRWLKRAVCLSLVVGMGFSSGLASASGFIYGAEKSNGGMRTMIDDSTVSNYTVFNDDAIATTTITSTGNIIVDAEMPGAGNSLLNARLMPTDGKYPSSIPVINVLTKGDVSFRSDYTAVTAQSGRVNIGSADQYVNSFTAETTYSASTSNPTNLYSALYVQNAKRDENSSMNIYANNVKILSPEGAVQNNTGKYKYGNAIGGNYAGVLNLYAKDSLVVHGLIEGSNNYENNNGNGTAAMTYNIHAGTAKTEIIGEINAAGSSQVNVEMGEGSVVEGDLIATANDKQAGGSIALTYNGAGSYKGDINATTGEVSIKGKVDASGQVSAATGGSVSIEGLKTITGAMQAKNGGHIRANVGVLNNTVNNAAVVEGFGSSLKYVGTMADSATVDIKADTANFISTTTKDVFDGTSYNAAAVVRGGTMNITAKDINVGTAEHAGDRGFRLVGSGNTLNILADRIVSYTGDEFVHVREGDGTSANIGTEAKPIGYFEAHTVWGKDDYGVAILQANEGNTINFFAKEAVFDGSTNSVGGVFGSGSSGTVNVTADKLTIDGNICGSYGTITGEAAKKTTYKNNIKVGTMIMKGDINAGSSGVKYSTHDRQTEINLTVLDKASVDGNINVYENGSVKLVGDTNLTKSINVQSNGSINITAGDVHAANVKVSDTGSINVTGGALSAGSYDSIADGIKISKTGALKATSEQVFAHGYKTDVEDAGAKNSAFKFDKGNLVLTDTEMSLAYLKNIKEKLNSAENVTNITYAGTNLKGVEVAPDNTAKIEDLAGTGANLAGITGKTDNKDLTVGSGTGGETAVGGLGVKDIDLGTAANVKVNNGAALTLTGGEGTDLVKTTAEGGAKLNVSDGTLNLGTTGVAGGGTFKGSVELGASGTMNIASGDFTLGGTGAGELKTAGNVNIANDAKLNVEKATISGGTTAVGGTLTAKTAEISGGSTAVDGILKAETVALTNNANLAIAGNTTTSSLTAASGNTITVGNNTRAGTLTVANAELKGATLFLDPAWKEGTNLIANASQGSIEGFGDAGSGNIDGKLAVGQNAILSLGSASSQWAIDAFNESGLTWGSGTGEIGAALAIKTAQSLDTTNGGILVDGTQTTAPTVTANKADFAADSLLIVDVAGVGGKVALTGSTGSTLSVADGSKVLLANATAGSDVGLVTGFTNGLDTAANWNAGKIFSSDRMLDTTGASVGTDGKILGSGIKVADISKTMPKVQLVNTMNNIWKTAANSTTSTNAGIAFLSQAADSGYIAEAATAAKTINGAAQMAVLGGVQGSSLTLTRVNSDAISKHLSWEEQAEQDGAVWLEMNHAKTKVRDMDAGAFKTGYDSQFSGFTLGADFAKTAKGTWGAAFSYGKGDADSVGDFAHTSNDYDYYGLSVYKNWKTDQANIVADLGYMKTGNELKQNNVLGQLKADVDTKVITAGIRSEFKVNTPNISPYAGLRYVHLTTDSFNTTNDKGTVFETAKDTQNVWLLPLGVSWSKEIKKANGYVKPIVNLGVVAAFGDKDANTTVNVPGLTVSDTMGVSIADSLSFVGSAGVEFKNKNVTYGLSYQLQASSNEVRNGFNVSAQFSF